MSSRSEYKKLDDLSAWDLDKGCRRIIDQTTPANRRLRDILRKQARKRINKYEFKKERDKNGKEYSQDI